MNTTIKTLAALGVAAVFLVALLPANAQEEAEFGTQVQPGDTDFIPVLDRVWALVDGNICFIDFGETNVQEFGFYLRPDAGTTGNLERFAVRLTQAQGNAAGTLVLNSHTAEQNRACTDAHDGVNDITIVYGDVNNNGRYDEGDYVWLTTDDGAGDDSFVASSDGTTWTLRLTQTNGGAAGTLVFAQDADFTSYSSNVDNGLHANSRIGIHNADRSGGTGAAATFTTGDQMYLALAETGTGTIAAPANGALVPMHSLRLHGDQGGFGSQVGIDDPDFVPLVNEISPAAAAFVEVCVVQFGDGNNVNEFGFYLDPHSGILADDDVESGFIRLKGPGGDAGSRVTGTATTEVGRNCDAAPAFSVHYADRNNNARYDEGDWVFMVAAAAGGNLEASSDSTTWTLRLTDTDAGDAGSLVFASDSDFQAWGQNTGGFPDDGANWGVFDQDRSGVRGTTELVTNGDSIYLTAATGPTDPYLVPVYSIRIMGDAGAFGSQVQFGDEDFIPTLDGSPVPGVCVVELGDGQTVAQFGFYLVFGAQASVPTNAVRLVSVEGNPAGSTVRDAHTTERGQPCHGGAVKAFGGGADQVDVHYTDLNNNGRYDSGDAVYLVFEDTGTASGIEASQSADQWSIRLTEAGGSAPGTLVFSGDDDFQSRSTNAPDVTGADVAFFDADLSGGFNRGDAVYVTSAALAGENLVPLYSIRVTGQLPAGGGGGQQPTPTPTGDGASPTPTDDGNETVSPTPTGDGASPTPTGDGASPSPTDDDEASPTPTDDEPTPGFGLVAILAAFGLLAVALRRRS